MEIKIKPVFCRVTILLSLVFDIRYLYTVPTPKFCTTTMLVLLKWEFKMCGVQWSPLFCNCIFYPNQSFYWGSSLQTVEICSECQDPTSDFQGFHRYISFIMRLQKVTSVSCKCVFYVPPHIFA